MNTITTTKTAAKSGSELVIMLLICAIGLFGAISLVGSDKSDQSHQSTITVQQDAYSSDSQPNETIVLD